jgi:multidrug resistance protein, MATE family
VNPVPDPHHPDQPKPAARSAGLIARCLQEWKSLALLGGPILIAQLAQMANGVIDTVMAGHASAEDLAAVGIGAGIWGPILLFFIGTLSSLQPIISGQRGAQQLDQIMSITWQGIYIALAGIPLMLILICNIQPLLHWLQLEAHTAQIAQGYLDAFAWGVPALLLLTALRGLTDGLGHTGVIMAFSLLSTAVNLPLNYIFIYGYELQGLVTIPAMGGIGCGWATTISNWIALLALLMYLARHKTYRQFHLLREWAKPHSAKIKQLLRLGLPIGFSLFVEVSMFSLIALFLSPLGPQVIAGHQIVLNATSLLFMVPLSLGMALTLRVSYLIGAQNLAAARLLARSSLVLALSISCISAPILYFGRHLIAAAYTGDPSVIKIAVQLFVLCAIFQVVDVIQVTMNSVLRGFQDTKIPMYIVLFSFWGICLPLGFTLTYTDWLVAAMGAAGFWAALIAGLSCAAILLTYRMLGFKLLSPHSSQAPLAPR